MPRAVASGDEKPDSIPPFASAHFVRDFQDGKIQFDGRLGRFGGEIVADQRGELVPGRRKLFGLFGTAVSKTYPFGNLSGLFRIAWLISRVWTPYSAATSRSSRTRCPRSSISRD